MCFSGGNWIGRYGFRGDVRTSDAVQLRACQRQLERHCKLGAGWRYSGCWRRRQHRRWADASVDGAFSIGIYTSDGTSTIGTNRRLMLAGNSTNNGTINLNDTSSSGFDIADLNVDGGPITISGNGSIGFNPVFQDRITATNGGSLILGSLQTLAAGPGVLGEISARLDNRGTIMIGAGSGIRFVTNNRSNKGYINNSSELDQSYRRHKRPI